MKIRHPFPRRTSNSLQYDIFPTCLFHFFGSFLAIALKTYVSSIHVVRLSSRGGRAAIMEFQTKKANKTVYGVCCHWCRQKTAEDHVRCSICPRRFCRSCLLNRHGMVRTFTSK